MERGAKGCSDLKTYAEDGRIVVDHVGRHEHLAEEMKMIAKRVGLPEVPTLPRAKERAPSGRRSQADLFTPDMRARIACDLTAEMELFGYRFEDVATTI